MLHVHTKVNRYILDNARIIFRTEARTGPTLFGNKEAQVLRQNHGYAIGHGVLIVRVSTMLMRPVPALIEMQRMYSNLYKPEATNNML